MDGRDLPGGPATLSGQVMRASGTYTPCKLRINSITPFYLRFLSEVRFCSWWLPGAFSVYVASMIRKACAVVVMGIPWKYLSVSKSSSPEMIRSAPARRAWPARRRMASLSIWDKASGVSKPAACASRASRSGRFNFSSSVVMAFRPSASEGADPVFLT